MESLPQKPNNKEEKKPLLERLKVKEQWESQVRILNDAGILEIFPESKQLGIRGIDGKEYPVPTWKDIAKKLEGKKELIERKMEQGFTKMLIVPFAYSLDTLADRYKRIILSHHKEGKLLATKEKPTDPDEKLELDEDDPLYIWDQYKNADKEGKLAYFPDSFKQEGHGGKTKTELLTDPSNAWQIILIEDMPNIPRVGKGKTIGDRPQLETNKPPDEYLKILKTDKRYKDESGLTPEADLLYAITHLEETNQAINDYSGKGSYSYQLAGWFPSSGYVPGSYWRRPDRRARLGRSAPGFGNVDYGVRPSVRV